MFTVPERTEKKITVGSNYIGRIPKVIMQTNKTHNVSEAMYNCIMSLIDLNPDMTHVHFGDEDIIKFIKEEYDDRHLLAFKRIIPGAFKADFFRLLYLYKRGGIYCDADIEMSVPFTKVIKNFDKLIVFDDGALGGLRGIWNALMISPPEHPAIKINIEFLLDFIEKHNGSKIHMLEFGPGSLYKSVCQYLGVKVKSPCIIKDVVIYEGLAHPCGLIKSSIICAVSVGRLKILADNIPIGYSAFKGYGWEKFTTGLKDKSSCYVRASASGTVFRRIEDVTL